METSEEPQELVLSKMEEARTEEYLSLEERVVLVEEGDEVTTEEQVLGYLEVQPSQLQAVSEGGTIYLSSEGLDLDNQHLILAQGEEGGEYIVVVGSEEEALAALTSAEGGFKLQQALQQHKEELLESQHQQEELQRQQEEQDLLQKEFHHHQQVVHIECQEVSHSTGEENAGDPDYQDLGTSEVEMSEYETVQMSEVETEHVEVVTGSASEVLEEQPVPEEETEQIPGLETELVSELESGETYIVETEQLQEVVTSHACSPVENEQIPEEKTDEIHERDLVEIGEQEHMDISEQEPMPTGEQETVVDIEEEVHIIESGEQEPLEVDGQQIYDTTAQENLETGEKHIMEIVDKTNFETLQTNEEMNEVVQNFIDCSPPGADLGTTDLTDKNLSDPLGNESGQLQSADGCETDPLLLKSMADRQEKFVPKKSIEAVDTVNIETPPAGTVLKPNTLKSVENTEMQDNNVMPTHQVVDLDGDSPNEIESAVKVHRIAKSEPSECEVVDLEMEEDEKTLAKNDTKVVETHECEVVDLDSESDQQETNSRDSMKNAATKSPAKKQNVPRTEPENLLPYGLSQLVEAAINVSSQENPSKVTDIFVKEQSFTPSTRTSVTDGQVEDKNSIHSKGLEERKNKMSPTSTDFQEEIIFEKVVTRKTVNVVKSVSVIKQTPKDKVISLESEKKIISDDSIVSHNQEVPMPKFSKQSVIQEIPKEKACTSSSEEATGSFEKTLKSRNSENMSPSKATEHLIKERSIGTTAIGTKPENKESTLAIGSPTKSKVHVESEISSPERLALNIQKKSSKMESRKEEVGKSPLTKTDTFDHIKETFPSRNVEKSPIKKDQSRDNVKVSALIKGAPRTPNLLLRSPSKKVLSEPGTPQRSELAPKMSPELKMCRPAIVRLCRADAPISSSTNKDDSPKIRSNIFSSQTDRPATKTEASTAKESPVRHTEISKVYPKRSSGRLATPVIITTPTGKNYKGQHGSKTDHKSDPNTRKSEEKTLIRSSRSREEIISNVDDSVSIKARSGSPKVSDSKIQTPKSSKTKPSRTNSDIVVAIQTSHDTASTETGNLEKETKLPKVSITKSLSVKTRGSSPRSHNNLSLQHGSLALDDITSNPKLELFKAEENRTLFEKISLSKKSESDNLIGNSLESIVSPDVTDRSSPKVSDVKTRSNKRGVSPIIIGKDIKIKRTMNKQNDVSFEKVTSVEEPSVISVDSLEDKVKSGELETKVGVRTRGGRRSSSTSKDNQVIPTESSTDDKTPGTMATLTESQTDHKTNTLDVSTENQSKEKHTTKDTIADNGNEEKKSKRDYSAVSEDKTVEDIREDIIAENQKNDEDLKNAEQQMKSTKTESTPTPSDTQSKMEERKVTRGRGRPAKSTKPTLNVSDSPITVKLGDESVSDSATRVRTRSTPKATVQTKVEDVLPPILDKGKSATPSENREKSKATSRGRSKGGATHKSKKDTALAEDKQNTPTASKVVTVRTRRSVSTVGKGSPISSQFVPEVDVSSDSPNLEEPCEESANDKASPVKTAVTSPKTTDVKETGNIEVTTEDVLESNPLKFDPPVNSENESSVHVVSGAFSRENSQISVQNGNIKLASPPIEHSADIIAKNNETHFESDLEQQSSSSIPMVESEANTNLLPQEKIAEVQPEPLRIFPSKGVKIPSLRRFLKPSQEKEASKVKDVEDAFAFTEEDFEVAEIQTKAASNVCQEDDEPEIPPLNVRIGIGRTYSKASPCTVAFEEVDDGESLEISFKHIEDSAKIEDTGESSHIISPSDTPTTSKTETTDVEEKATKTAPVVRSSRLREKAARRNSLSVVSVEPSSVVEDTSLIPDTATTVTADGLENVMPTISSEEPKQKDEIDDRGSPNVETLLTPTGRAKRKSSAKSVQKSLEKPSSKDLKSMTSSELKNAKAASAAKAAAAAEEEEAKGTEDVAPLTELVPVGDIPNQSQSEVKRAPGKRAIKRKAWSLGGVGDQSSTKKAKRVSFGARGRPVKTADQRFDDLMKSTPTKPTIRISLTSRFTGGKRKRSLSGVIAGRKFSVSPKRKNSPGITPHSDIRQHPRRVRKPSKKRLAQSEDSSDDEAMSLNVLRTYSGGKAFSASSKAGLSPVKRSRKSFKGKESSQVVGGMQSSPVGSMSAVFQSRSPQQKSRCQFHICCQGPSPPELRPPTSSYVCRECHYRTPRIENIIQHYKECSTLMPNQDMLRWEKVGDKTPTRFSQEVGSKTSPSSKKDSVRKNLSKHLSGSASSPKETSAQNRSRSQTDLGSDEMQGDWELSDPVDSDDSGELATADPAWKNTFGFVVNDIVWADWKNDHWPALVRKIYPKQKKVSVCFIENQVPEKGMKIHARKLTPFDDAARNKQLLSKGGPNSLKVKAVQRAEDYLRKRFLGVKIKPMLFFNNPDGADGCAYLSGGEDSDEESIAVATREGSPLDPALEETSPPRPASLEECASERAALSSEELDKIKERLREQNLRLLDFIKEGNVEGHLLDVFHERIPSDRHQKFNSEVASVRNQLKHSTWFGPLESQEQRDEIIEYCMSLFKSKCERQEYFDIVAYVFEVWIPEALIQAMIRLHSVSEEDAELRFTRGSDWLPQDLLVHQQADQLLRETHSLDPLTSKRQKVLEKLRAIGIQEELLQAVTPTPSSVPPAHS